jgi:hypothetical protein
VLKIFLIIFLAAPLLYTAPKESVPTYVTTEEALAESGYLWQGEYLSDRSNDTSALQVVALGNEQFRILKYSKGLPRSCATKQEIQIQNIDLNGLKTKLKGYSKIKRMSPTMGLKAPSHAKIIFDGKGADGFVGKSTDGKMQAGASSSFETGSFFMHLEFKLPYKPTRLPSNQDRGNSGVYIFNRYEVQVLDTFGLDLNVENNPGEMQSIKEQWCGALYKKKAPDINMAFPPLDWQTYEIDFTAPKFDAEGKKVSNARISVRHNGVWIHKDLELDKGTGAGGKRPELPREKIYFQNHGNPTEFRNVWLIEK